MPADQDTGPETVAFAVQTTVREGKTLYQPIRLHLGQDGQVQSAHALHDAMPYMALAYEYLQGDLARWYAELQAGLAREALPPPAAPRRGRPPKYGPGAKP